jgi:peptidylprolyl isomerase
MSKLTKLYSLTAVAALFACTFACGQSEQHKTPEQQKNKNHSNEKDMTADAASVTSQPVKVSDTEESTISQTELKRLSEAFGHFIGRNLKMPGINFDLDSIIKGMREGYEGKPAPMADKEYEALMTKVQEQAYKQLSTKNLKAANEFMAKNAKEKGVVELEPGKLDYMVLQEGTGPAVAEHASPQIKYTGKFLDGTVFGSSDEVGGSITIPLDQTIPGFSKGLIGMKEGEKRRLFVHPDVGYGTSGHLPPNSLLIFDIELQKAATKEDASKDNEDSDSDTALEDELSLLLSEDASDDDLEDDDADSNSSKKAPTNPSTPQPETPKK